MLPSADYLPALATALRRLETEPALHGLAGLARTLKAEGRMLWLCGNGGSFAVAQHWAADLAKAAGLRCRLLGGNLSALTALANDVAFDHVFADELAQQAQPEDGLVVISVSGRSPNVLSALNVARRLNLRTVAIVSTRPDAAAARMAEIVIRVPSADYGVVEDAASALGHWLISVLGEQA